MSVKSGRAEGLTSCLHRLAQMKHDREAGFDYLPLGTLIINIGHTLQCEKRAKSEVGQTHLQSAEQDQ